MVFVSAMNFSAASAPVCGDSVSPRKLHQQADAPVEQTGLDECLQPGEIGIGEKVQHLREDDQVEVPLRQFVWNTHLFNGDVSKRLKSPARLFKCRKRAIKTDQPIGAQCQFFGEDANRASDLACAWKCRSGSAAIVFSNRSCS